MMEKNFKGWKISTVTGSDELVHLMKKYLAPGKKIPRMNSVSWTYVGKIGKNGRSRRGWQRINLSRMLATGLKAAEEKSAPEVKTSSSNPRRGKTNICWRSKTASPRPLRTKIRSLKICRPAWRSGVIKNGKIFFPYRLSTQPKGINSKPKLWIMDPHRRGNYIDELRKTVCQKGEIPAGQRKSIFCAAAGSER